MNPIELELFGTSFAFIAEEMGAALRRTAYSPNIKERVDASCAWFDAEGRMAAQAEHIPVHLGSMPMAVEAILQEFPGTLREGDQVILNDPYRGGTHLPDVTLVRPAFFRDRILGYTVNRAHHADIGGIAPGSMPADATRLEEEGIVLEPQKFLDRGRERRSVLDRFRKETLNPEERLGDLRAQVAANELGARRLHELASKYGVTRLNAAIDDLLDYGERRIRAAIRLLPRGTWSAEEFLESGGSEAPERIRLHAEVTIGGSGITVDFTGTDRQVHGNVNAPLAVTRSATYYVVRCLTDPDAPRNAGAYRPVRILAEEGLLVHPRSPAAVAAGNVETSQRIVDVVFLALASPLADRVPAQSQGTMNNLTIGAKGPQPFSYYETIAGGEGALPYRAGMSGVHTHMTNTLNTPIEALELATPLRVEEYRLIDRSGGKGQFPGGDGVRRSIRFLSPQGTASILSERRAFRPKGLAGGEDGRPGRNVLVREGHRRTLPSKVTLELRRDDVLVIETPGGGGWGPAASARPERRVRARRSLRRPDLP
ncbi:MAG TPA: hydantoinase B/oxoprolinase family protein [Thermoplasmata archaeon]|nr:hydantoinase B/oxoprolinase family protein [Thermoplasmata archaeon]